MKGLAVVLVLLTAGVASADDDLSAFRPMPRPDFAPDATEPTIRPQPRPVFDTPEAAVPEVEMPAAATIRPKPRPDFPAVQVAVPVVQKPAAPVVPVVPVVQKPAATLKGALCQRADLKGKVLAPIRSVVAGCNVPDAVLVSNVGGVALNPPATIDCEEAQALSVWVKNGLQPAFQNTIVALNVADSYACRPRNNVRGAPVSVHGLGQAIDISGFVTNTGRTYTVAQSYNAQIKAAQKAGCGTFHTILGPGSDGYHENHIHFDVAHHGGSDYCH